MITSYDTPLCGPKFPLLIIFLFRNITLYKCKDKFNLRGLFFVLMSINYIGIAWYNRRVLLEKPGYDQIRIYAIWLATRKFNQFTKTHLISDDILVVFS